MTFQQFLPVHISFFHLFLDPLSSPELVLGFLEPVPTLQLSSPNEAGRKVCDTFGLICCGKGFIPMGTACSGENYVEFPGVRNVLWKWCGKVVKSE